MSGYKFTGKGGDFIMEDPQYSSGLYIPVAGNTGLRSAVSPDFGGDSKLDQNHFLIAPKSISNLHSDRDTRNFFCVYKDGLWSACGASAGQEAARFTDAEDKVVLEGGRMWQKVTRTDKKRSVTAEVTIFSLLDTPSEIMNIKITNDSDAEAVFTPVAAIPVYGRSADNLRDHRHVTSLLNRAKVCADGIVVKPTLSFDERGHQINDTTYFVLGAGEGGASPKEFIADADLFLGEGGTFLRPRTLLDIDSASWKKAPFNVDGKEMIGALKFDEVTLKKGESLSFRLAIGATTEPEKDMADALLAIKKSEDTDRIFEETRNYWNNLTNIHVKTGDEGFDNYMEWITFQPQLRRIYGCSFLPHHDYGRGGRGWRDLWQDCLALLLTDPDGVRKMIIDNFKGVRFDGTNATIIGDKPGEFKADRNGIPRVWMDHGFWPFLTLKLYMDQTGDIEILGENTTYFKDALVCRAEKRDSEYSEGYGVVQKDKTGAEYLGTVLEHILIENVSAIYDVGDNGEIRLRGADWNDALDMATHKGESVAFTCGYAGNLVDIAKYIRLYAERSGKTTAPVAAELKELIFADGSDLLSSPDKKRELLMNYMDKVSHAVSGEKEEIALEDIAKALESKAEFMMNLIRDKEWVKDSEGNGWFNGYYDDNGERVEGEFDTPEGKNIRMMLTGQVFSVMSGTAREENVKEIIKSADKYLYKEGIGGYRLNTDFKALRTDLGRMFGFSYGDKENGAVFSHMAVMFGNALYRRGFAKEGYKALNSLYKASSNFEVSRIYPGVPEYFNAEGRGLYNYLTGAASWMMMTVVTQSFGVRGEAGDLCMQPALLAEQFDNNGIAAITLPFRGKEFEVRYINSGRKEVGDYQVSKAVVDGKDMTVKDGKRAVLTAAEIDSLSDGKHTIEVYL
ncbi:GH36-type glycosyl hydrolase domain-containing protein [Butyrivibrio sp. XPD2006]|uniref:GH36-type glycosyl hydrolase domain-containing protein n=1 Tax=Butyrivibrio sp. XPD2006 TaxID=1280668 RepID=UPI0003B39F1C|nr:cellobiose phosphorylase [Butyrivibrio sp. XPD2006]